MSRVLVVEDEAALGGDNQVHIAQRGGAELAADGAEPIVCRKGMGQGIGGDKRCGGGQRSHAAMVAYGPSGAEPTSSDRTRRSHATPFAAYRRTLSAIHRLPTHAHNQPAVMLDEGERAVQVVGIAAHIGRRRLPQRLLPLLSPRSGAEDRILYPSSPLQHMPSVLKSTASTTVNYRLPSGRRC